MNWEIVTNVLIPCVAAVASYYGSHMALNVHFEYLRRDVEMLNAKMSEIIKEKNEAHEKIHERIDKLQSR